MVYIYNKTMYELNIDNASRKPIFLNKKEGKPIIV